MVIEDELLHRVVAKEVIENKMITVAGQMSIEYVKELDNSNQKLKGYKDCFGDIKIENDALHIVCGDNIKQETCSEKDEI